MKTVGKEPPLMPPMDFQFLIPAWLHASTTPAPARIALDPPLEISKCISLDGLWSDRELFVFELIF
jgi:hypothetical protein